MPSVDADRRRTACFTGDQVTVRASAATWLVHAFYGMSRVNRRDTISRTVPSTASAVLAWRKPLR